MRAAGGPCNFILIIEPPEKNIAILILVLYSKKIKIKVRFWCLFKNDALIRKSTVVKIYYLKSMSS